MPDALLTDGSIMRSRIAHRYLLEVAMHGVGITDVITLRTSGNGLDFTACSEGHVAMVEFHLASDEFDEYEAVEGEFPIETGVLLDALRKVGHGWDSISFRIRPDMLIIGERELEMRLPRSNLSRTHIPGTFETQAGSRFECGFLQNILRQLGECIVEIELCHDGPIIMTKRTEPDGVVIRYTLAPMAGDWEAGRI